MVDSSAILLFCPGYHTRHKNMGQENFDPNSDIAYVLVRIYINKYRGVKGYLVQTTSRVILSYIHHMTEKNSFDSEYVYN
jgi:hypothetical protein